jgi:hypothetical protein
VIALLRGVLTIIFILKLATVISQYDNNPIDKPPKINVKNHPVILSSNS